MLEATGNLWNFDGLHCITTNGFVKNNGSAVMGKGCAKEASTKYPALPFRLGQAIRQSGNHVYLFSDLKLITFPVKHVWWNPADLNLIYDSCHELMTLHQRYHLGTIYLVRPGCGNGQLKWQDVKPVIEPILSDYVSIVQF